MSFQENKKILDEKYAELLLKRCLRVDKNKSLLIDYTTKEINEFVETVIEVAKKIGVKNVDTILIDSDEYEEYLNTTELKDIKINKYLDRSIWDKYAKNKDCILHIATYIPNNLENVDEKKMKTANQVRGTTFPFYRANNTKYTFPWVISAYPNQRWADIIFPNDPHSFEKLYYAIMDCSLVTKDNPIAAWNDFIIECNSRKKHLQNLNIEKLHYKNNLGTDLEIGLPKNTQWLNLDKGNGKEESVIVNLPSYEIFTSPDFRKTNGVVFNSRPLVFDNRLIDNFYIEFRDGEAIKWCAKEGGQYLNEILMSYHNSRRLGEVALLDYNSPIANTGLIYYDTLFDENASCHLALGRANPNTVLGGKFKSYEELEELGLNNNSNLHVDFMIGTPDLEIEAQTPKGKQLIMTNGHINF